METRVHLLELLVVAHGVPAVRGGVDDEDHLRVLVSAQRNEVAVSVLHGEVEDALGDGIGHEDKQQERHELHRRVASCYGLRARGRAGTPYQRGYYALRRTIHTVTFYAPRILSKQ